MGFVEGIVKGIVNGEPVPIAGAMVKSDTGLADVATDENGYFKIDLLVLGSYNLEIFCPGFEKQSNPFTLTAEQPEHDLGVVVLAQYIENSFPPTDGEADANVQAGVIVLSWIPPAESQEDVAEYNIYRSRTPNINKSKDLITTVPADTLIYYDVIPPEDFGRVLYYQIESVDAALNPSIELLSITSPAVVAPPVPQLKDPADGSLVLDFPFELSWHPVEDDYLEGYTVQLSSSPDFPQDERTQELPADLSCKHTINSELASGTWYWRVNAVYQRNVKSGWSETRSIITMGDEEPDTTVPYLQISPQILRQGEVRISYYLTTDANVLLRIFNLKGQLSKSWIRATRHPACMNTHRAASTPTVSLCVRIVVVWEKECTMNTVCVRLRSRKPGTST